MALGSVRANDSSPRKQETTPTCEVGSGSTGMPCLSSCPTQTTLSTLLSWSTLALLLALISRRLHWWDSGGSNLLPLRAILAPLSAALIGCIIVAGRLWRTSPLRISPNVCAVGLVVYYFSDAFSRPYSLFLESAIRGEIILCGLVAYLLLRKTKLSLGLPLLLISILTMATAFLERSGGAPLHSDDHSVFFFRLSLLATEFPNIPFYAPMWNGGFDARDFFATGAFGVYLLFAPLIHLMGTETAYNIIVLIILFIIAPLATYSAARLQNLKGATPAVSAILALVVSLLWFRWGLKYGTLGFCLAASLLPLNLSLGSLLVDPQRPKPNRLYILSFFSISLMLSWVLIGVAFIPLTLIALTKLRSLAQDRKLLLLVFALIVFNGPWIGLLWKVSKVSSFLAAESSAHNTHQQIENENPNSAPSNLTPGLNSPDRASDQIQNETEGTNTLTTPQPATTSSKSRRFRHRSGHLDLKRSLRSFDDFVVSLNPLIYFLALPGLLLLNREYRLTIAVTILWLAGLGTLGVPIKPQLELDRMLLVAALLATVPAGLGLSEVLAAHRQPALLPRIIALFAGGFLMTSPFIGAAATLNRSLEQYTFRSPLLQELAGAITKFGGDGRTVFAGFYLHELDQGHLAPLALYTNKPLVASSFVHNVWWYTSVFPDEYAARGEAGIEEFLDLYNATAIIAREPLWRKYFSSNKERYQEVWYGHPFHLYTRKVVAPTYFVSGNGAVLGQTTSAISLRIDSNEAVIKFRYFPFLTSEGGCRLSPYKLPGEIEFIHLTECVPKSTVHIRSVSPLRRMLQ